MDGELPQSFGPYALLSQVGRGGMGEVFLAKTGGLQGYEKYCVVKMLRAEVARDTEYSQRFSEEARVVVQLAHRNIANVFDVGRVDGDLYMAMEHVIGRDLRQLAKADRVPVSIAIYVLSEVLEAVDYAHRFVDGTTGQPLALVHRDVSPHNILLGVEGDVKLIDFGVATTTRLGPVTQAGTVLGKLNYMAPEHARGEDVDGRADQWSAAVVLVELLLGKGFYDGLDRQAAWAVSGMGTHRPEGFAQVEPALRAILDRALAPSREDRFPSCSAFAAALVSWAREHGEVADCRDVRALLAKQFGDLADEARRTYRAFARTKPPTVEIAGPGASPWESIATTMMVAPPTTGVDHMPSTMIVRDRSSFASAPTRPNPPAPIPWLAAAFGAGCAAAALIGLALVLPSVVDDDSGAVVVRASDAGPPARAPVAPDAGPTPTGEDVVASAAQMPRPHDATAEEPTDEPPSDEPDRPRKLPPPPSKPKLRYDKPTRDNLAYLAGECRTKVPCAQSIIDWSKRAHLETERAEVADAAVSCAQKCRLK